MLLSPKVRQRPKKMDREHRHLEAESRATISMVWSPHLISACCKYRTNVSYVIQKRNCPNRPHSPSDAWAPLGPAPHLPSPKPILPSCTSHLLWFERTCTCFPTASVTLIPLPPENQIAHSYCHGLLYLSLFTGWSASIPTFLPCNAHSERWILKRLYSRNHCPAIFHTVTAYLVPTRIQISQNVGTNLSDST